MNFKTYKIKFQAKITFLILDFDSFKIIYVGWYIPMKILVLLYKMISNDFCTHFYNNILIF
jgi:hypothetical protein